MENINSNSEHLQQEEDMIRNNNSHNDKKYDNMNNNENFEDNHDDDSNSDDDSDSKRRNKRRSKNDNDGRNFRCSICDKSYLSYPALYTHIKTKHNNNGQTTGRGRGRPKKDTGDVFNSLKSLYNPITMDYFKSSDKFGETLNVDSCLREVYEDLSAEEINIKLTEKTRNCKDYSSHPFIRHILENLENPPTLDGEGSKCDEVFADYLVKVSRIVNETFFVKVVKFVFLFRECLNDMHKDKDKDITEEYYSESRNAEDAPDISNDFVTDYLDLADNEKYGFSKEDAIDLTQNFCQWLYDNNFTCSKLSLINNNY